MGSIERFVAHAGVAWCCITALSRAEEPGPSAASTRTECLAQHERGQDARLAGQLLAARLALRECSAAICPALVTRDCVAWLSEVDQQIPSVIFRGTKDGEDIVALRVSEADRRLAESVTGNPLELDPGPHHFIAELPGFPAQQATYVLQAGDKARVVRFDFASPPPSPASVSAASSPEIPPRQAKPRLRPIPTLAYVLGGTALAGAVTSSVLGAVALSKRDSVEGRCAPLCDERDVRGVKNLALASDVSLAIALLAAGGATYSYVTRPGVPEAEATASSLGTPRFRVTWTGLGVAAGGHF